ncbi:MAG: asparaginase [Bacilli bacterium]|nr:asparaginase [Bacilli bacterium]
MKKILLIATGGTIACKVNDNGLAPALDGDELLSYLDDLSDLCTVDCIQLFNLDSTNMTYSHWAKVAKTIKDKYGDYDGFVVTHGTDTMAYAASALSYMVQNSRKPIVFTGSQKSIYMRDNDARNNLTNALIYASFDGAYGVTIVFDNKVIIGTRAKKVRSKSYNAFTSVNYPEIARIIDKKVIQYINKNYRDDDVAFYLDFNTNVMVLKLVPGLNHKELYFALKNYDAVIIEGFGVGGLPTYLEEEFPDFKDKTVIITTQVQYEGSDLDVYQVGKSIKAKYGLLESYDMTIESLVSKTMWVRGMTNDKEEIKRLLYTPIYSDILR